MKPAESLKTSRRGPDGLPVEDYRADFQNCRESLTSRGGSSIGNTLTAVAEQREGLLGGTNLDSGTCSWPRWLSVVRDLEAHCGVHVATWPDNPYVRVQKSPSFCPLSPISGPISTPSAPRNFTCIRAECFGRNIAVVTGYFSHAKQPQSRREGQPAHRK